VARIGAGTAARLGIADGDRLTVSGAIGSITLPALVTAMPDEVVWLPMRSPGSEVRAGLGTGPGGVVRLSTATTPAGEAR
jgi:NADH-quinone oxidoreductase subunit G